MRTLASILLALAVATPAAAETVLIQNGRVVTNTSAGIIENGDVLIVDGQVRAVGVDVAAPRDARVIDAQGKWVTPGAFAATSTLGLNEISGSGSPNDANMEGNQVSAAADAARAFNPTTASVAVTRAGGVTRAAVSPGAQGSMFDGIGALVTTSGDPDSVFRTDAFMVLRLGEAGATRAGGSRAALWPELEAALRDAREYPARYRSGQGGAVLNEMDAQALQPYAQGRGLIVARVESATDIRELIRFKQRNQNLRIVILGATEGWLVAEELARANIPVIVDPYENLPASMERLAARHENAGLLSRAGVRVAIASAGDNHGVRGMLQLAGNAVAHGMDWDDAFAAVSRVPAEIFGARGLGVLERGAVADVVVWDGDPLDVKTAATAVFIDGEEQSMNNRQIMLRDRYNPRNRTR